MATKAEHLEVRLTATERMQIEHAAALAGQSVSSFVVLAALDRTDTGVRESTVVPRAYFDRLVASLDEPEDAQGIVRATQEAGTCGRIKPA